MSDMHLALHGLAIKKHAMPKDIAEIVGMDAERVASLLEEAESRGRVARTGGKFMLTAPAQVALRSEYSRVYADQRSSAAMNAAYDDFEKINVLLKHLITDWQTMDVGGEKLPNDHSNKDRDQKIIDRLGDLHERSEPILKRMAAGLPRLGIYMEMLTAALEKAEDGAIEWVSDARIASYHTVWFELHEDLLRALGRERVE
ncbi:MAG TPA: hypothetical protein VII07_04440 [Bradyrhizobium sp.]|jgi:hypothetical protein